MSNAPVQFRRVRDLGQIISDTFYFLKDQGKPLYTALVIYCLGPGLVAGFFMGKGTGSMQAWSMNMDGQSDMTSFVSDIGGSIVTMLLGYVLLIVVMILLTAITYEYIRAYHLGEHVGITSGDLWRRATAQLGNYFVANFLYGLVVVIGAVLCVAPGIYFWVAMGLVSTVVAIERTDGTAALSRSMTLVKDHWWETFGLLLIVTIISSMITGVVTVPFMIASMFVGINSAREVMDSGGTPNFPGWYSTFMAVGTSLQYAVTILTLPITAVAITLKYFTLVEEKENPGLQQQVAGFDTV